MMQIHGAPGTDERTLNEAYGFLWRIATQAGAHKTDYLVDAGTAHMMGGARAEYLLNLLVKVGVLTRAKRGGFKAWSIVADPEFIHLRTRAELEADARYRDELRDVSIKVGILLRDGDNCRWCGIFVQHLGRKGQRHAEFDHLEGKDAPGTVANMVMACRKCNRARGRDTELWDYTHTIRPVPTKPQYGEYSADFLTKNGYPTAPTHRSDEDTAPTTAAADTAPNPGVRPAALSRDPQALAAAPDSAPERVRPAAPQSPESRGGNIPRNGTGNEIPKSDGTGSAGSGRDGAGSTTHHPPGHAGVATGPPPDPLAPQPTSNPRRRRGRRGGSPSRSPRTQGDR